MIFYFTRCDVNILLATLCTRSIQTREGSIVKALDCNAAVAGRDALAKTVYARLFDWYACGQCKITKYVVFIALFRVTVLFVFAVVTGLLIRSIGLSGKISIPTCKSAFWIFMVLSALRIIGKLVSITCHL